MSNEKGYILKVNGKYFGYGVDPMYPEALFKDRNKAYVFKNKASIERLLKWYPHKTYEVIEVI